MRDQWNMFAKMCRYPAIKDIGHFGNYYFNRIWLGICGLLYISYSAGRSPVTPNIWKSLEQVRISHRSKRSKQA